MFVLLALAAGGYLTRSDWLPAFHRLTASSGTPAAAQPTGPPCPARVAATIPGGGNSIEMAVYESAKFRVTLCETSAGKIYYHGSDRHNPALYITLPAEKARHGYKAHNNVYMYYVSKHRLVITKNGVKVLDQRLKNVS